MFGQTITHDAHKATIHWTTSVSYKLVRGSFTSSTSIGAYTVGLTLTGTGAQATDNVTPPVGSGFWYLVRRFECIQTSWQSTLGLEPGRDVAIP